jgi:hypothetical protein
MTASVVDVGQAFVPQTRHTTQGGFYQRLTASGVVKAAPGQLIGFYVANTNGGTVTLWDNTSAAGAQISGIITPAPGFCWLPAIFMTGLYAQIGGTALDATFLYL